MPTLSPNMSLQLPIVGVDSGLVWENAINTDILILDGHNHSPGSGTQISPSGLSINTALPFLGNFATGVGGVSLVTQTADPAANLSLYSKSPELYFKDGAGNVVQLTSGGVVNATSSGITSGTASAAFTSGILVAISNVGVAAAIDAGAYILRYSGSYPSPSGNAIVLAAPSSLSGTYQLTLPAAPPASTSFATIGSSGTVAANIPTTQGIAQGMLALRATGSTVAAGGVATSASSGFFSTASTTPVAVTNLSVTITTTGRPVYVGLISDPTNPGGIQFSTAGGAGSAEFLINRGATIITQAGLSNGSGIAIPVSALNYLDIVSAGTYTYTISAQLNTGIAAIVSRAILVAYEI